MNKSALATDMLKWEIAQRRADELAAAIRDSVLQLEETVVTGNVRATYRKPRKSYDYARTAADAELSADALEPYTITSKRIDWKRICADHFDQTDIPYTESLPSVSLKLED